MEKQDKTVIRLAGMMFMFLRMEGNTKIFVPVPKFKSPFAKQGEEKDYLEKTKERMKNHGVLSAYEESLKPENRECAGCM